MARSSAPRRKRTSRDFVAAAAIMPMASSSSPWGTKPRSRAPTRDAAVWRTASPFQSSSRAAPLARRAASARTSGPSGRAIAPCPTITTGRLASASAFAKPSQPSASSDKVAGPAPRCS